MRAYLKTGERHSVGVVGLGKLGLPMAALMSYVGHDVIGFDKNVNVVDSVNDGVCPIIEPSVQQFMSDCPFQATTDIEDLADVEAVMVIVPTPSDGAGWFEVNMVHEVLLDLARIFENAPGKTVVVCSTVMPGSMDGTLRDAIESTGLRAGETVDFLYSPEFIALGSVIENMRHPEVVLIGSVNGSDDTLYQKILIPTHGKMFPVKRDPHERYPAPVLHQLSAVEAEIAKISLNTYVTMKISFANVLGEIAQSYNANPVAVANAIGEDSRVGKKYLRPGAAYGGPCFPRDTDAFNALCSVLRIQNGLPNATRDINDAQARRIAREVGLLKNINSVAVLGIAYKPGTPVTERSAGIAVAETLERSGYTVLINDPIADNPQFRGMTWLEDPQEAIDAADCVVLMCPHEEYEDLQYPQNVVDPWRAVRR